MDLWINRQKQTKKHHEKTARDSQKHRENPGNPVLKPRKTQKIQREKRQKTIKKPEDVNVEKGSKYEGKRNDGKTR